LIHLRKTNIMEENLSNHEEVKNEIVGKVLEGTIAYRIELSEEEYGLKFDRDVNSELLSMMVTRELFRYNKEVLTKSLAQCKPGKAEKVKRDKIKDRLKKVGGTEYILSNMIDGVIGEILTGSVEDLLADDKLQDFDKSGITPEGLADTLLGKGKQE
jgi:hypothetical protein